MKDKFTVNHLLWAIGLLLGSAIVRIDIDNLEWVRFLFYMGDALLYFVYAIIAYVIYTFVAKKDRTWKKYMWWATVIVLGCTSQARNVENKKAAISKTDSSNEYTREKAIKIMREHCLISCYRITDSSNASKVCDCYVQKVISNFSDDDLSSGKLMQRTGVKDSLTKWVQECIQ